MGVTFELPKDTGNSPLTNMTLVYQVEGAKNATRKTLPLNRTGYTIRNLIPYTTYIINVTVMNRFFSSDGGQHMITTKQARKFSLDLILLNKLYRKLYVKLCLKQYPVYRNIFKGAYIWKGICVSEEEGLYIIMLIVIR